MSDETIKISPEVRAHLESLEESNGRLTPAVVVADAKRKNSPLHGLFDWNVKKAAEKWWEQQARIIIRSVTVVVTTEHLTLKSPRYVRDPSVPAKEQGYVSVIQLQQDPVAARQSLLLEFGRAEGALARARTLASVLGLDAEVEALIAHVAWLRERLAA